MTRAPIWSALLLTALAASGCGTPPITEGSGLGVVPSKPTRLANSEAQVTPPGPADGGLVLTQGNSIVDLTVDSGSVTVSQVNQLTLRLVDDPLELLKHYVEVPYQMVWDLTTRSFFIEQANLSTHATGTVLRQANNLFVVVDARATCFSGTIVQFNGIDHFTPGPGGAAIAQLNDMTVVRQDDGGTHAEDFVAELIGAPAGSRIDLTAAAILDHSPRSLIYIDLLGKPHYYVWQPPIGKNGLDGLRRHL